MKVDSNFTLPQAFYATFTTVQQCYWQKFTHAVQDNNGDTSSLHALEKTSATKLETFSKKQKQKKDYEKAWKKQRKVKANGDNVNPYTPSSSVSPALSIESLSSGDKAVPISEKTMPIIRILMFKEPMNISLPISGNPLAQRPNGKLAISPQQSSNPKEEEIALYERDFTYLNPPLTVILNVQIRQTNITCWVKQHKLSVDSKRMSDSEVGIHYWLDIYGIAQRHEWKRNDPESQPKVSTDVLVQLSVMTGKIWTVSILNTGCDWSMVAQGWHVVHEYNELFHCQGAFFTGQTKCPVDWLT